MKCNKWTLALAAAGVVSLGSVVQAEEAQHQVLTALSSTTLSGYIDTSAIWKFGSDNHNAANYTGIPGRVFDGTSDKLDGFNLDVIKLTLEKPLDEGQWSAGYKADLLFGPDAQFYQTAINGGSIQNNQVAIKQAYVALRAPVGNGIDFKMGVFDTILGYEVFDSPNNPNFSRSYGFNLEPTQHTGLLASYNVTSWLSVAGGVANTAFGPINTKAADAGKWESSKAYMGSVTLTAPDSFGAMKGSVLYAGVVNGIDGSRATGGGDTQTSIYVGGTINTPVTGLSLGAAWDYRHFQDDRIFGQPGHAYSLAGYASYAITEKFKANARVDYLNGDDGTFGISPAAIGEDGVVGSDKVHLLASTLTLDYSLWENVLTRAEVRWDHSLNGLRPYGNADEKNAVTLTANIVYKF